jgi:hypothetical protein
MEFMFYNCKFKGDLSKWKPIKLKSLDDIFFNSKLAHEDNMPYWAKVDIEFLPQAIQAYEINKKLNKDLPIKIENKNKSATLKL